MVEFSRRKLIAAAGAAPLALREVTPRSGGVATASNPRTEIALKPDPLVATVAAWIAARGALDAMMSESQGLETTLAQKTQLSGMTLTQAYRCGLPEARAMRTLDREIKTDRRRLEREARRIVLMRATSAEGALAKIRMGLRIQGPDDWADYAFALAQDGCEQLALYGVAQATRVEPPLRVKATKSACLADRGEHVSACSPDGAHIAVVDLGARHSRGDQAGGARVAKISAVPKPQLECRARPSRALKANILETQSFRCLGCGATLNDVEFDHVIPLGLGGANAPDNWAALCPACHRGKTVEDLKRIAKAKRQRRYHETGRSRPLSKWTPFGAPVEFSKHWRRHLDGAVTRRCDCDRCR